MSNGKYGVEPMRGGGTCAVGAWELSYGSQSLVATLGVELEGWGLGAWADLFDLRNPA